VCVYTRTVCTLYAIGKAVDNSQPCVRGVTQMWNNVCKQLGSKQLVAAFMWQTGSKVVWTASWYISGLYHRARTPIWINILFEFDTICFAR